MSRQPPAMDTIRRVYIYAVTAVTLIVLAIGLTNLLALGIDRLLVALTGDEWMRNGPDWARERLSFSIPFIVIAAPIWYLHWRMAERAIQGEDSAVERRSLVRAAFFMGVVLVALAVLLPALSQVVQYGVEALLGGQLDVWERESLVSSLASAAVVGAIWVFHIATYRRDIRVETVEERSALLPQVALYLAAGIGGMLLLFGVGDLLRLGVDALADAARVGRWWREPLASGLGTAVTGGVIWALHWRFAERALATSSWWGGSDTGSQLRRRYLVVILLLAAFMAIFNLADGVDGIARTLFDLETGARETRLTIIAGPLLAMLPFAAFWLLHRRRLLAEAGGIGFPLSGVTARRLLGYAMAALGFILAGAGLALLLGEALQLATGTDGWRSDIGFSAGLVAGGSMLWWWYWREAQDRLAADAADEQRSEARRTYLFVVFGAGLVALVVGLAMTVYQVMQEVLGVAEHTALAGEIASPLGVTVVSAGVAVWHGRLLRRDLAVQQDAARAEAARATEAKIALTLAGPSGGDVEAVVETLRRHLPEGYRLDR